MGVPFCRCAKTHHNHTLCFTRAMMVEDGMTWMRPGVVNLNFANISGVIAAFATIAEIVEDHAVFCATGSALAPELQGIIATNAQQSQELKVACRNRHSADPDITRSFGWLLSDHFPDMYDNK
ncbi:unnamed protein product [Prorocentrum cordatum]|uniref:Uncharacterized protein n=1 Tax=Prorocentrum cordatum TaxID=2364126 RepID=A0ABN9UZA4_9DINO|nr:unnamed protein product [Polarella glacialis]